MREGRYPNPKRNRLLLLLDPFTRSVMEKFDQIHPHGGTTYTMHIYSWLVKFLRTCRTKPSRLESLLIASAICPM